MSILNKDHDFKVLLAGHVDEIGMMITMITSDGLAKVTNVGGIRPALYLGQKVRILTKNGIIGGVVGGLIGSKIGQGIATKINNAAYSAIHGGGQPS